MYKTAAEINLSCLKANMRAVKARCRNIKICAALKADAYGHGAVRLAVMLEKEKLADYFGVANIEEGAELRKAGIKTPVLLFSLINTEEIDEALANRLTITVCDHKFIELINRQAEKFKLKTPVHIKTDTGMGRIGWTP
ncbi:MAG TPA: alanine racemase, partial [Spirochaetia bacterium]|nr:alanine racemase [Spirochaetia bacterium]